VNPRPLNPHVPTRGLIGCFSADESMVFATAWEPYQELFQGVITCLHSDFRIGGLKAGETKQIRGKIYFLPNDIPALLKRYGRDFPEHSGRKAGVDRKVKKQRYELTHPVRRLLGGRAALKADRYSH
jgi:hypothetical protein